ncbi:hypothetical protein [Spiribacter onubensis]|uniref:Uncharacterized protein n=1 Tax=Spiribacter onubensis TaxID=3122420 RepID=A0ABV3S7A6_9GAMM
MSSDNLPFDGPNRVVHANYNIRFHPMPPGPDIDTVIAWVRENGIEARLFDTFDGGGSNGLILECRHVDDLLAFQQRFLDDADRRGWAEDTRGGHHPFRIEGEGIIFTREEER